MENSFLGLEAEELILGWWKADLGEEMLLDYYLNIIQQYINMMNVLFLQEQAQSICKVLSASFDCALASEKS